MIRAGRLRIVSTSRRTQPTPRPLPVPRRVGRGCCSPGGYGGADPAPGRPVRHRRLGRYCRHRRVGRNRWVASRKRARAAPAESCSYGALEREDGIAERALEMLRLQLADEGEEYHFFLKEMAIEFHAQGAEDDGQRLQDFPVAFAMFRQQFLRHGLQTRQLHSQISVVGGDDVIDQRAEGSGLPVGIGDGGLGVGLDVIEHDSGIDAFGGAGSRQRQLPAAAKIDARLFEDADGKGEGGGDFADCGVWSERFHAFNMRLGKPEGSDWSHAVPIRGPCFNSPGSSRTIQLEYFPTTAEATLGGLKYRRINGVRKQCLFVED